MKTAVQNLLEKYPKARSRVHKNLALGWLLKEKYGLDIPNDKMADLVHDTLNADRYWRLTMAEHKEWQNGDYHTKQIVEQEYELSLGYEPMHHQFIKQAKLL